MPENQGAKPKDEFLDSIVTLADRYKLEGEEKADFIHQHLTKAGYTVERTYVPPAPESGKNGKAGGNGWFKE